MQDPNFVLLYVNDVAASVKFYSGLLGRAPAEASPNFAMFPLASGLMLGLWARHDVTPASRVGGGGAELCFPAAGKEAVLAACSEWRKQGVAIAQEPTEMDFGFTFTGLDPDGHRLRVFHPVG